MKTYIYDYETILAHQFRDLDKYPVSVHNKKLILDF